MSKDSVESLTKDLKDILLKTKQELKNKDDYIKKTKNSSRIDQKRISEIVQRIFIGQKTTSAI